LGWKGPLEVIYPSLPEVSRDIFNQTRLLRALSNLALNVSRDGASTTSLGKVGEEKKLLLSSSFPILGLSLAESS